MHAPRRHTNRQKLSLWTAKSNIKVQRVSNRQPLLVQKQTPNGEIRGIGFNTSFNIDVHDHECMTLKFTHPTGSVDKLKSEFDRALCMFNPSRQSNCWLLCADRKPKLCCLECTWLRSVIIGKICSHKQ